MLRYIFTIVLCSFITICTSQSVEANQKSANFQTEAVSSNGAMNYNMPIASIKGDMLSHSIGLQYYTGGGVPVGELASSVGLGWSMTGNNVITRTVRGIPDEGYQRNDILTLSINGEDEEDIDKVFRGWLQEPVFNGNTEEKYLCALGVQDSAPDEFTYTAGAYSGSFHFEHRDTSSINDTNLIVVNHQKNNVLIQPVFTYRQEDGSPCSEHVTNCDCGAFLGPIKVCGCDNINFDPGNLPECCFDGSCDVNYCSSFCCTDECDGYDDCKEDETACLHGVGSVITQISFIITTPDGQEYYYGGNSSGLILEDKSASLSTGVELDEITINAAVTNAWRINKIESTIDQRNTNRDRIQFIYDSYESYSYIDAGAQKWMMKAGSVENKLEDNGDAIHTPCHDYFNKFFAQENNDGGDINEEEKNYQNILYSRAGWNVIHYVNAPRVKKIKSKYEVIEYHYNQTPRKDLYSGAFVDDDGVNLVLDGIRPPNYNSQYDQPRAIDYISHYANDGSSTYDQNNLIKRVAFTTDYYHNTEGANTFVFDIEPTGIDDAATNLLTVDCNRLMLTEVATLENDLTASTPQKLATSFQYDLSGFGGNSHIHRRCSLGRDYWGYNNGITYEIESMAPILPFETNSSLRPHLSKTGPNPEDEDCFSTQDRTSRWPEMRAGMLTGINLPTGAEIEYTYGANAVTNYPFTHLNGSSDQLVGGVRLEKTTVYNSNNDIELEEDILYEKIIDEADPSTREPSGKLLYIPTFVELFDQSGTSMLIHNGNYSGTATAICKSERTLITRGMIYSTSITPRVNNSGHIGYSSIIKKVDTGMTETKYIMPTDDELMGTQTPQTHSFGLIQNRVPADNNMKKLALQRGQISEKNLYEEDDTGTVFTKKASTTINYDVSYGTLSYKYSQNEYGGMPFQKDYKWSSQFIVKLGASPNSPISVFFLDKDIPAHCEAAKIELGSNGGQHNYFATVTNEKLYGRVERSRTSSKVDDVTTTTTYEYKNYNDTISQHRINPIRVLKRIRTYNELDQYEKHVVVYQYAGEDIYNDPTIGNSYQGDSPLVMYRPEADDETAGPNTIKYLKDRHIHSPLGEQLWFTYGEWPNLIAKHVSGTYDLKRIDSDILVSEFTYQFIGNSWNLSTKATEWNNNGTPKKIYQAHIGTTYNDPLVASNGGNNFNPNYEYLEVINGLAFETYIKSSSDKLNHKRYSYYPNRLPKSELMIKGDQQNEDIYSGVVTTYDDFNRPENQYEGVSNVDASGQAVDYKSRKRIIYKLKGLGDNENSINTTTFFSSQSNLIPITEKSMLDDLSRLVELTQYNNGTSTQLSYVMKTNVYNKRNTIETSYDIGRDTKTIQYENSPLSRQLTIESLQAIDDESVQYRFASNNSITEISGYNAFTLYKSEITDIDGITISSYTDYLQRPIVERRYNDQGNPSDTRTQYDDKGRISRIIPPTGDMYVYTYNDKGLISTKSVPHGGTRTYYYDELLRLVLEVDANGNKMVNIYDDFNRVIQTGLIQRTDFTLPTSTSDYYGVGELALTSADLLLSSMTYHPFTGFLASESLLKMDGNSSPTSNDYLLHLYSSYDEVFGLPTQYAKTNIMGGLDYFELEYNDAGEPIISLHTHQKDTNNPSVRHFQQKTYFDEMNRPWKTYLLFEDDPSQDGQLLSEIKYDEHSRISKKKLHEVSPDNYLEEVDFGYDKFGRIISINGGFDLCTYQIEMTNTSDNFQFGKLFYSGSSFFDLSTFSINSNDDLEAIENSIIAELESQTVQGGLSPIIIDDFTLSIEQLPNNLWQLSIEIIQSNYTFCNVELNETTYGISNLYCCEISEEDPLYWQKLSYLKYIEDVDNEGGLVAVNSTNIHRKEYGYGSGVKKIYQYQYDALNRLNLARYAEGFLPNTPDIPEIETDNSGLSGAYSTQINYQNDLGDIGQIFRFGSNYSGTKTGASWDLLDAIDYSYDGSGKLLRTTEYGDKSNGHKSINGNGQNLYTYDSNGNIISDSGKGITNMTYTHFNLPQIIDHVNNESLEFIYDPKGVQLQKTHKSGSTILNIKSYCHGIEYTGTSIANSTFEGYYHSDGIIKINDAGNYEFHYFIKDHLGNIVIQFADVDDGGFITSNEIIQENDYYPFGAKIRDSGTAISASDNQYQYNGKEMHRELDLNMYAYGARFYDPNIARFTGVDPIADEFPFVSVFNYAENTPIGSIDLHGLQEVSKTKSPVIMYQVSYQIPKEGNLNRIRGKSETISGELYVQFRYDENITGFIAHDAQFDMTTINNPSGKYTLRANLAKDGSGINVQVLDAEQKQISVDGSREISGGGEIGANNGKLGGNLKYQGNDTETIETIGIQKSYSSKINVTYGQMGISDVTERYTGIENRSEKATMSVENRIIDKSNSFNMLWAPYIIKNGKALNNPTAPVVRHRGIGGSLIERRDRKAARRGFTTDSLGRIPGIDY